MALLLWTAIARAQEPFLPGQVKSQALADSIWHPPCAHVGVTSEAWVAAEAWDSRTTWIGMTDPDTCRVALNAKDIEREARDRSNGGERIVVLSHGKARLGHRAGVRWYRREVAIWTCTVLVHEYGHLARYSDPVGYQGETGATLVGDPLDAGVALPDHSHSDDPHNIMYPFIENTYAPCRALFPKAAISRRATRLMQR